ncbi:MAG TPA: iron-containing alcohol dehydrogenase [Desulfurivibrionaceae bacterium]|nr:iron-containing alcohol dehydrogenase [Desulfurivibrionaceae bacterium]
MPPKTFTVTQPTRLTFGAGAIDGLAALVRSCGGSKAFLVVDPGVKKAGLLDKITAPLQRDQLPFEIFDKIDPEPGLKLADNGCKLAKKAGCDCVIGVGGGSAMDVAKAVAILMTNGGKAEDYLGLGKIKKAGVPKIMVPTTAGTGAEVTFTAVFINEKTKSKGGMNGDPLYPEAALLDPELTLSMPPHVTAATGIDAFIHAVEAYLSTQAHPISDMYALEAIELISQNLPKAYAHGGNLEARSNMMLGSLLGGKALATAGVGLVHAMSYPLGGMFGIPHGLANAVLLPFVIEYNLIGNPAKYAAVAEVMGYDTSDLPLREAASLAVEAIYNLNRDVGIPGSLAELGIPVERLEEMADIALTVTRPVENNPRKPTRDEVIQVYRNAMAGWE